MKQRQEVIVGGRVFDLGIRRPLVEWAYPDASPETNALEASSHTVSWALEQYRLLLGKENPEEKDKKDRNVEWIDRSVRMFTGIIGDMPVHQVTPLVMARFAAGLRQRPRWEGHPFARAGGKMSKNSIRNYCKGIKTMLSGLTRVGAIAENPLAGYTPPEGEKKLPRTLTPDQVRDVVEQTDPNGSPEQLRDRAMLALYYDSGCRESELCNLIMDNLKDDHFTVPVKGGDEKVYWFEKGAAWDLQRYLEVRPQNGANNVFLTWDGRLLTRRRAYEIVHKYMQKAGLKGPRLSPHTLRHSCGREIQRRIGNLEITRKKLNHKDIKSTFIYAQLEDEDVKRAQATGSPYNALGLPRGRRPKDGLSRDARRLMEIIERIAQRT